MTKLYSNSFYRQYAHNVFSQNGEDGVISEIFRRLGIKNEEAWACEFGAWDGVYLSNTFNLVVNGVKAVYIEGDPIKFKDLLETASRIRNIIPVNAMVGFEGSSSESKTLDTILAKTPIPNDFDILSIDIDSFDYQVWRDFKNYKPKVVVVEINSAVDTDNMNYIHGVRTCQGTGFGPMLALGQEKGYKFVLHTGNMIFVREDLYPKLNLTYQDARENFVTRWGAK
jgi:hypothetical protein